jgi:hypothetical protein
MANFVLTRLFSVSKTFVVIWQVVQVPDTVPDYPVGEMTDSSSSPLVSLTVVEHCSEDSF